MNTFRQLKRITTWTLVLVVAVLGYRYWDRVQPVFNSLVEKYKDVQEISEIVSDIGDNIAGVDTKNAVVLTTSEEIDIELEIAESEEERAEGLMYREKLCDDCGMLFVFPVETETGFWMKNCKMALDIMFLDENGRIIDIKKDFEPCEEEECPSYSPAHPYNYALEVNAGWTDKNNVKVNDIVIGITSGS